MSKDFSALAKSLKGDLIEPSHTDYEAALRRWNPLAERRAAAVVFVKDAEDVSLVLKHAKQNEIPVAVRSGGHNIGGASSVEGGLVIDLSRHVTSIKVDKDRKVAFVGGGALWSSIDEATMEHGLAAVGATINDVAAFVVLEMLELILSS